MTDAADRNQRNLFSTPVSRRTDPVTSHEAEAAITMSGSRSTHCAKILSTIRVYPGRINAELAELVGLDLYEVTKRVSDLANSGRVVFGAPRINPGTGRRCRTVFEADAAWEGKDD